MKCLSKMFNISVPLNPKLCVLGIYQHTSKQTKLLDFFKIKELLHFDGTVWMFLHEECG